MRKLLIHTAAAALALVLAGPAAAACYADYKAKRDNPLRLHYGVMELPDEACADPELAALEIARRIAVDSWQLLNILSFFDEKGLEKRRESAGKFFLRY